jgi:hypothetical protein
MESRLNVGHRRLGVAVRNSHIWLTNAPALGNGRGPSKASEKRRPPGHSPGINTARALRSLTGSARARSAVISINTERTFAADRRCSRSCITDHALSPAPVVGMRAQGNSGKRITRIGPYPRGDSQFANGES